MLEELKDIYREQTEAHLDIEFKKLNFALESYRHKMKATLNYVSTEKVLFILEKENGDDLFIYESNEKMAITDMQSFKKKCINLCAHTKKEAK
jgi:hypothetical protein